MLEFEVKNQIIKKKDSFEVVADSRNYLTARFDLSEEWQGEVFVVFGFDGKFFQVLLDEGSACTVPFEVIKAPGFSVSLFCGTEKLVTANVLMVDVAESGLEQGEEPAIPSPLWWQQYLEKIQGAVRNGLPYIGDNGHWFLYDAEHGDYEDTGILAKGTTGDVGPQGENGRDGLDGYTPQRGVDYWTDEDKAEMVGEIRGNINWQLIESVTLEEDVSGVSCDLKGGHYKNLYLHFVLQPMNPDNVSNFPKGRSSVFCQGDLHLYDDGSGYYVGNDRAFDLTYKITMIGNDCIVERKHMAVPTNGIPYIINSSNERQGQTIGRVLNDDFISELSRM